MINVFISVVLAYDIISHIFSGLQVESDCDIITHGLLLWACFCGILLSKLLDRQIIGDFRELHV